MPHRGVEDRPQTGEVAIDRYAVVDDFRHGGIVQGVGQVLHEGMVYDEGTGQPLTGCFQDDRMPRTGEVLAR